MRKWGKPTWNTGMIEQSTTSGSVRFMALDPFPCAPPPSSSWPLSSFVYISNERKEVCNFIIPPS